MDAQFKLQIKFLSQIPSEWNSKILDIENLLKANQKDTPQEEIKIKKTDIDFIVEEMEVNDLPWNLLWTSISSLITLPIKLKYRFF